MYVSNTAPLPQNSMSPAPAWKAARSRQVMARLGLSVASARDEYRQIAPPESFAQFGPNLVADVVWMQNTFNRVGQQPGSCPVPGSIANLSSASASEIASGIGADASIGSGPAVVSGVATTTNAAAPTVVPLNGDITVPDLPNPTLQGSPGSRIGAPWGDAGITYNPSQCGSFAGVNWKALILLGLGAAVVAAAGKHTKGRRR